MTTESLLYTYLNVETKLVYDKLDVVLENFKPNSESVEYGACSYMLNRQIVEHRFSKITPTKTGQFVTVWKRDKDGKTVPFDI